MTSGPLKYTRAENERRWLVPPAERAAVALAAWDEIADRYIDGGRLRLRAIVRVPGGARVFKLAKKLGSPDPRTQPIVNIYLDEQEHRALSVLPAAPLEKRRYHHGAFSVDVFAGALAGLMLCEAEAESLAALDALTPPPFAGAEVTADAFLTGASLARAAGAEVRDHVRRVYGVLLDEP